MKNVILKYLSFSFVVALVLSSCSRNNSVVSNSRIQKRKHTSGFHIDLNKKHKTVKNVDRIEQVEIAEVQNAEKPENNTVQNEAIENANSTAYELSNETVTDVISIRDEEVSFGNNTRNSNTTGETKSSLHVFESSENEKAVEASEARQIAKKIKKESKKESMRIDSIIYIILCIFIPFVAVGLATDWDPLQTVIALILTLLFWIPGMIYAFYVCDKQGVL